jgi:undecaprenyl-diphosphatase
MMACFLLFAATINLLLKYIFKVPLFPHLGVGYAFPRGHMHVTAIFYGYVLYKINDLGIKALMAAILLGEGFSLVYLGFHDLPDLIGALGFAALEILCYHQLVSEFGESRGERYAVIAMIFFSMVSMVALSMMNTIPAYIWSDFYGLAGIVLASSMTTSRELNTLAQKFIALLTVAALNYAIYTIFEVINPQRHYFSEIKYLLFPVVVYGSIYFYGERKWSSSI